MQGIFQTEKQLKVTIREYVTIFPIQWVTILAHDSKQLHDMSNYNVIASVS